MNRPPTLKNDLFFCLVVFAATVCMPCIHIRDLKLHASRKVSSSFSSGGMNE